MSDKAFPYRSSIPSRYSSSLFRNDLQPNWVRSSGFAMEFAAPSTLPGGPYPHTRVSAIIDCPEIGYNNIGFVRPKSAHRRHGPGDRGTGKSPTIPPEEF